MHLPRSLLPWIAGAALSAPAAAFADTSAQLPKGYTSDELPALPSSPSKQPDAGVQPASDTSTDEYSDTDPSAVTEFQQPLSPYGVWVVDANYGTVWVPNATVVGADFAPYQTAGHWALDQDGEWLWVSDYEWGYIPFHYGRWVWISGRGWAWIPGRVYAPAWVVWRVGDEGYIGWAPMPPAFYWSDGVAVSLWVVPPAPYVFCSTTYVFSTHVHQHVIHDHVTVQQAARHTHPYKAANPSGGGKPPHKAADPSGSSSSRHAATPGGTGSSGSSSGFQKYQPASPSLGEAHIPATAVPKARVAPEAKALSYARRSTTPRAAGGRGGSFSASPGQSRRGGGFDAPSGSRAAPSSGFGPAPRAPSGSPPSAPAQRAPSSPSTPHASAPQAAPQSAPPVHAPSHAAPSRAPSRPAVVPPRAPAAVPRAAPARPRHR